MHFTNCISKCRFYSGHCLLFPFDDPYSTHCPRVRISCLFITYVECSGINVPEGSRTCQSPCSFYSFLFSRNYNHVFRIAWKRQLHRITFFIIVALLNIDVSFNLSAVNTECSFSNSLIHRIILRIGKSFLFKILALHI